MKYEFKVHTDKGIVREVNEDNMGHMLNTPSGDIFVVCDGMGGHVGGQTASTIGVESIISNLVQRPQSNLHVGISNALIFANEQVLGRTVMEPSLKGMGSTATVAVIKDDLLYVGHVGDSRAYIFSDGKLYRITRDDSYVQMLVDNNTITEDQAETHPQKNRILKALGSQSALEPNSAPRPFKMKTGDVLLLCSDGLCSMVVDEAIEQLIDTNDLQGSINQMHSMAMNNGGKDNITIILLKVTESPHLTSDFTHFTTKYQNQPIKNVLPIEEPAGLTLPVNEKPKSRFGLAIGIAASLFIGVGSYFYLNRNNSENSTKAISETKKDSKSDKEKQETSASSAEVVEKIESESVITEKIGTKTENNKNDSKTISKKEEAENLGKKYEAECNQYKRLCGKTDSLSKAKIKTRKETLDNIWDDWSNTGYRPQGSSECDCD